MTELERLVEIKNQRYQLQKVQAEMCDAKKIDIMQEMREIQEQINELHKKQAVLRDKKKIENIAEIRRMDWLKGKSVMFVQGYVAAGLSEFSLRLSGKIPILDDVLELGGHVCLYGDNNFYENNIVIRSNNDWNPVYSMDTNNGETLVSFIKENRLKISGFSEKKRLVYRTILENLAD